MPHYTTVARCTDPGCRCLDRAGVILYAGPDRAAADEAKSEAPAGYEVEVEGR